MAEKSNEITAIPELLALLDVSGCIVTIDAMGSRKEITRLNRGQWRPCASTEREPGATLPGSIKELFEDESLVRLEGDFSETVNQGHGRLEHRRSWSIADHECLSYLNPKGEWRGMGSVAKVTRERRIGEAVSIESRHYISSLPGSAR